MRGHGERLVEERKGLNCRLRRLGQAPFLSEFLTTSLDEDYVNVVVALAGRKNLFFDWGAERPCSGRYIFGSNGVDFGTFCFRFFVDLETDFIHPLKKFSRCQRRNMG